jgi:hypothetical protein
MSDLKRCSKCGETKPADTEHFPPSNRPYVRGLHPYCRDCEQARARAYRQKLHEAGAAIPRRQHCRVAVCGGAQPRPEHEDREGALLETVTGADGQTYFIVQIGTEFCYALAIRKNRRLMGLAG